MRILYFHIYLRLLLRRIWHQILFLNHKIWTRKSHHSPICLLLNCEISRWWHIKLPKIIFLLAFFSLSRGFICACSLRSFEFRLSELTGRCVTSIIWLFEIDSPIVLASFYCHVIHWWPCSGWIHQSFQSLRFYGFDCLSGTLIQHIMRKKYIVGLMSSTFWMGTANISSLFAFQEIALNVGLRKVWLHPFLREGISSSNLFLFNRNETLIKRSCHESIQPLLNDIFCSGDRLCSCIWSYFSFLFCLGIFTEIIFTSSIFQIGRWEILRISFVSGTAQI